MGEYATWTAIWNGVNTKPTDTPSKVPTAIQPSGTYPNYTPVTVPTTIQTSVIKKGIKPDERPKNVWLHPI